MTLPEAQLHARAAHVAVGGQTCPQAPQLLASIARFTHAPPHTSCPVGHRQVLAEQVWPVAQAWPQVPQFAGSVWTLVQSDPHWSGRGARHRHAPAPHWEPGSSDEHSWPQLLQFAASLWRLVQYVPQLSGLGGRHRHAPPLHCDPGSSAAQAWPQLPQLAGSPVGSTHSGEADAPQEVTGVASQTQPPAWHVPSPQVWPQAPQWAGSPVGSTHSGVADRPQEMTGAESQTQAPAWHVPSPQAWPQAPQWASLVWRSTQTPPQAVWPSGQVGPADFPPPQATARSVAANPRAGRTRFAMAAGYRPGRASGPSGRPSPRAKKGAPRWPGRPRCSPSRATVPVFFPLRSYFTLSGMDRALASSRFGSFTVSTPCS